ncbi:hypothetical protein J6W34_05050 [bacterium]|nr:hypothetical protein [bacterium]
MKDKSIKKLALKSMAKQKLPKKYANDSVMQNNKVLRVVLNSKKTEWTDYRNINDDTLPDKFYGDTLKFFNVVHKGKREKKVERHGYRWLAWANNYREMFDILKKELKITEKEMQDIDLEKVNMKEINRSILISCNEFMRDEIYWSKM